MGAAAYYRGNALISRQIRREFGLDCPEDRAPRRVTPRPKSWGDATRERAILSARGFCSYEVTRGRAVSVADLVEFLSADGAVAAVCGRSTAESVAVEVLGG
jgi:hypothetical protein